LPAPEQLVQEGVDETETGIIVRVRAKRKPRCPTCAGCLVSYHSGYQRRERDLPWQGRRVEIRLHMRRFRCRNTACQQKIFAERLPGVIAPRAREPSRLREVVSVVGYALGGLPACRLLQRLGVGISRDTVLRRVKSRIHSRGKPEVRVLGVDDWAWRKRQPYGTMLMDLERRRGIDLLPVRSAGSFANWLRSHP
jgi:transposase